LLGPLQTVSVLAADFTGSGGSDLVALNTNTHNFSLLTRIAHRATLRRGILSQASLPQLIRWTLPPLDRPAAAASDSEGLFSAP